MGLGLGLGLGWAGHGSAASSWHWGCPPQHQLLVGGSAGDPFFLFSSFFLIELKPGQCFYPQRLSLGRCESRTHGTSSRHRDGGAQTGAAQVARSPKLPGDSWLCLFTAPPAPQRTEDAHEETSAFVLLISSSSLMSIQILETCAGLAVPVRCCWSVAQGRLVGHPFLKFCGFGLVLPLLWLGLELRRER